MNKILYNNSVIFVTLRASYLKKHFQIIFISLWHHSFWPLAKINKNKINVMSQNVNGNSKIITSYYVAFFWAHDNTWKSI